MAEQRKISIRFYNDHEVRAIWDDGQSKWWFSVLDIVGAINDQDDYMRTRNYRKYLKNKLRSQNNEVVSVTNQSKLLAPDGKRRMTDVLDYDGVMLLAQNIPNTNATRFVHWFSSDSESIDGKSATTTSTSKMAEDVCVGEQKVAGAGCCVQPQGDLRLILSLLRTS